MYDDARTYKPSKKVISYYDVEYDKKLSCSVLR